MVGGVGVVGVVFSDNKAPQARIGIWDKGLGIWDFEIWFGFGLGVAKGKKICFPYKLSMRNHYENLVSSSGIESQ